MNRSYVQIQSKNSLEIVIQVSMNSSQFHGEINIRSVLPPWCFRQRLIKRKSLSKEKGISVQKRNGYTNFIDERLHFRQFIKDESIHIRHVCFFVSEFTQITQILQDFRQQGLERLKKLIKGNRREENKYEREFLPFSCQDARSSN